MSVHVSVQVFGMWHSPKATLRQHCLSVEGRLSTGECAFSYARTSNFRSCDLDLHQLMTLYTNFS